MTSEQTREKTEQYFAENNYFGLDAKNVVFFEQSTMPCTDFSGRIMLETRCSIAKAPGNKYLSLSKQHTSLLWLSTELNVNPASSVDLNMTHLKYVPWHHNVLVNTELNEDIVSHFHEYIVNKVDVKVL